VPTDERGVLAIRVEAARVLLENTRAGWGDPNREAAIAFLLTVVEGKSADRVEGK